MEPGHRLTPAPSLRGEVITYFSVPGGAASRRRVIPDGCVDLLFNLAPDGRGTHGGELEPEAGVLGTLTASIEVERPAQAPLIGIVLAPGTTNAYFDVAAHELRNRHVSLSDLLGAAGDELLARLREEARPDLQAAVLDAFLKQRRRRSPNPTLLAAVELIRHTHGQAPIRSVGRELGISPRRLERLFAEQVGVSPKTFARITRFGDLLRTLDGLQTPSDLLAFDAYADQAHMIREFRAFTETTPRAYLRERLSRSFNTPFAPHANVRA